MEERIGFIGVDPIVMTLASLTVKAGYLVTVSALEGDGSVAGLASLLGCGAREASAEECAKECEMIVISIPIQKYKELPVEALAGKIVVDTCNYFPQKNGKIYEIENGELASSELIQDHLEGAKVVKAFHNIDRWHLYSGARPFGSPDRWALPIAGDDETACAFVARWMGMTGFDPIYCGHLSESWRIQAGMPIFILPYVGFPPSNLTKDERRIWYRWERTQSVTEEDVRRLVNGAQRGTRPYALMEDLPSGLMD